MDFLSDVKQKMDENGTFVYPLLSSMGAGALSALFCDYGVASGSLLAGFGYIVGIFAGHCLKKRGCPMGGSSSSRVVNPKGCE